MRQLGKLRRFRWPRLNGTAIPPGTYLGTIDAVMLRKTSKGQHVVLVNFLIDSNPDLNTQAGAYQYAIRSL